MGEFDVFKKASRKAQQEGGQRGGAVSPPSPIQSPLDAGPISSRINLTGATFAPPEAAATVLPRAPLTRPPTPEQSAGELLGRRPAHRVPTQDEFNLAARNLREEADSLRAQSRQPGTMFGWMMRGEADAMEVQAAQIESGDTRMIAQVGNILEAGSRAAGVGLSGIVALTTDVEATDKIRAARDLFKEFKKRAKREPTFQERISLSQEALELPRFVAGTSEVIATTLLPPFGVIPAEKIIARGVLKLAGRELAEDALTKMLAKEASVKAFRDGITGPKLGSLANEALEAGSTDSYVKFVAALNPEEQSAWVKLRERLPRELYDRNFALRELSKATGRPVHELAQLVPGAIGAGEDASRLAFMDVLKGVKNWDDLEEYMVLMDMGDTLALNPHAKLAGNIDGWSGQIAALKALKTRLGDEGFASIEAAGAKMWEGNDEWVIKILKDEGMLNRETLEGLQSHRHYMPAVREGFSDGISTAVASSPASISSIPIKRRAIEGSVRALDQPLNRFLSKPMEAAMAVARNKAARQIALSLEDITRETGEEWVRYIEPSRALKTANRVTGEITPVRIKAEHSDVWETISYFDNGVKNTVEVPTIYASIAKGLDEQPGNILDAVGRAMSAPLRHGAITYNPAYLPVAIGRDVMQAAFREKVIPFGPDFWIGLWGVIKKNSLFSEAARGGVFMSGMAEHLALPRGKGKNVFGAANISTMKDFLLYIPRLMATSNVTAERAMRLATFNKLKRDGVEEVARAVRSRDVTVDFSKSGNTVRLVNQWMPFTNAAVQGNANILRTMRDHPKWAATFAGLVTIPTVMIRVNNMRFETNGMIDDFEYVGNWVIQFAEGTRKDGTKFPLYGKIPKGEVGMLFSFPAEVMFSASRGEEDRSAVDLLLESGIELAKRLSPIDPTLAPQVPFLQTGAEVVSGENFFTGAPIIPRREESLLPEQQFGQETSKVAIALGQQFKISPRLIDFAINDFTAGAGQSSNWLLSMGLEAAGYSPELFGAGLEEDEREGIEKVSRIPVIKRFLGTRDTQLERRGFDRLTEVSAASNREFSKIPQMNRIGARLGEAGRTVSILPGAGSTSVELSPQQRATIQKLYADLAMERIPTLSLTGTDEEKRDQVRGTLTDARSEAKEKFIDQEDWSAESEVAAFAQERIILRPYWDIPSSNQKARQQLRQRSRAIDAILVDRYGLKPISGSKKVSSSFKKLRLR